MHLKRLGTACLVIGLVGAGAAGCAARECTEEERAELDVEDDEKCTRIVPFKQFTGDTVEKTEVWEPGDSLVVTGHVRELRIAKGSSDQVKVKYQAQVDLAEDRSDAVVLKTMENLTNRLEKSGATLTVSADRGDSDSNLGAKVVIELPAGFDGKVSVKLGSNLPGDVSLDFLGKAPALDVDLETLGKDLSVKDTAQVVRAIINTEGDINTGAFAAADLEEVVVHSSQGDIETAFSAVPSQAADVLADFGDVVLGLPSTGDYTLQASGDDGVNISGAPKACVVDDDDENAQSMTCNAGDTGTLTFEVIAESGSAVINLE